MKPPYDWSHKWQRRAGAVAEVLFCFPIFFFISFIVVGIHEGWRVTLEDMREMLADARYLWNQAQPEWAKDIRDELLGDD